MSTLCCLEIHKNMNKKLKWNHIKILKKLWQRFFHRIYSSKEDPGKYFEPDSFLWQRLRDWETIKQVQSNNGSFPLTFDQFTPLRVWYELSFKIYNSHFLYFLMLAIRYIFSNSWWTNWPNRNVPFLYFCAKYEFFLKC